MKTETPLDEYKDKTYLQMPLYFYSSEKMDDHFAGPSTHEIMEKDDAHIYAVSAHRLGHTYFHKVGILRSSLLS